MTPPWVSAVAFSAGVLKSQKGINLPGVRVGAPALTEKDIADIEFSVEQVIDYLALSFVRQPADLETTRQKMDRGCLLIAKIEKSQALENLAEILPLSDAVMVAPRRPRSGVAVRGSADDPEADHSTRAGTGAAGDHGDADAGVDDREPAADAGGGV